MCGPARSFRLGHLASAAKPERWITLTAVSEDVRGAYEALRRLSRLLRKRGYTWEYLAVPERHKNGSYHLHLLQKGSFVPQRELSQLAERAGMGRVCWIKAIDQAGGMEATPKYLVKYMTKDPEQHPANVNRYAQSQGFWPGGRKSFEQSTWGSSKGEWAMVHLGSSEIRGDDGAVLWMGSSNGGGYGSGSGGDVLGSNG